MRASLTAFCTFSLLAVVAACSDDDSGYLTDPSGSGLAPAARSAGSDAATATAIADRMDAINASLAAAGENYRVAVAEYSTPVESGRAGQTVFANNRGNKQLSHHFVAGDPRRTGGNDIQWAVDLSQASPDGQTPAQTRGALTAAMQTWQNASCSTIPLTDLGNTGVDVGVVSFQTGHGGIPAVVSDVFHAGWLGASFFNTIAPPNGSTFILGVTFTFLFCNPCSGPGAPVFTDVDGDGRLDAAFREIYYNDAFFWRTNGGHIDIETVALHEAGHGLSQGHFGKIFMTDSNGKIHFSPLAVMNAAYSQVQRELAGTDNGGHCSIWGGWPN